MRIIKTHFILILQTWRKYLTQIQVFDRVLYGKMSMSIFLESFAGIEKLPFCEEDST